MNPQTHPTILHITDKRKAEAEKILSKYPDRIPVGIYVYVSRRSYWLGQLVVGSVLPIHTLCITLERQRSLPLTPTLRLPYPTLSTR